MRRFTSIASANALKHNGKQPGASSAACRWHFYQTNTLYLANIPRSNVQMNTSLAAHLAQLIGGFSLGGTAAWYQEAFLIESAHDAKRIVNAALVLVQSHLIAASAKCVRRGRWIRSKG